MTTKQGGIRSVKLVELVASKFHMRTIESIEQVDLEIETEPPPTFHLSITRQEIDLRIGFHVNTKRFVGWFGGLIAFIGVVLKIIDLVL